MIVPPALPYLNCVRKYCAELADFEFDSSSAEPFAAMEYDAERRIKHLALKRFWKGNELPGTPDEPIAATLPRHYRATSKRKGVFKNGHLELLHMGKVSPDSVRRHLQYSILEPDLHHKIYELVLEILSKPAFQFAARNLNYCIIRGSYKNPSVILNLAKLDSSIVRKFKIIADELKKEIPETSSCFLYLDESRSEYYLESKRPEGRTPSFKKLFGSPWLDMTLPNGKRLLYPPTGFSQINEAMIPCFLGTAEKLIRPDQESDLLDLYCGYGLLGLSMAEKLHSVTGVEIDGSSVKCAENSAAHLYPEKNIRYVRGMIGPELLRNKLPEPAGEELQILDPPKIGTADGVIHALGRREPRRVLHIFCGIDTIPDSIRQWKKTGYEPRRIVPLDFFPGTPNLETMILFEKNE